MDVLIGAECGRWLDRLRDDRARGRIVARIVRIREGNLGDAKHLGDGLQELRIDHGPGYRLYFTIEGSELIVVLFGGDKSTQQRDIARARRLLTEKGWRK